MSEPKGLREIFRDFHVTAVEHGNAALDDALIAWAKAYGEQVREACVANLQEQIERDTVHSAEMAEMPLPEPKP